MEREVLFSGIGGQGVQLGSQVLARAAAREGLEVMLLGVYGGTMRGGPTEATLVVSDAPIGSPPIVSSGGSAVVMHHAFFDRLLPKLRPGAVVVVNGSLFEGELDREAHRVFEVPATQLATDLGQPMTASLVLVAAYAGLSGLVGVDSLIAAMGESVPAYRRQHLETNEQALRAGFESVPWNAAPPVAAAQAVA